jgi:hypothetical protein
LEVVPRGGLFDPIKINALAFGWTAKYSIETLGFMIASFHRWESGKEKAV